MNRRNNRLIIWFTAPCMLLIGFINDPAMGQTDNNLVKHIQSPYVSEDASDKIVSKSEIHSQNDYVNEASYQEDSVAVFYDEENMSGILERGSETNDIWIHFSAAKNHGYEVNLYGILGERISSVKMETGVRHMKFSIPGTLVLPSAPYFVEMKDLQTGKSRVQKMFLN